MRYTFPIPENIYISQDEDVLYSHQKQTIKTNNLSWLNFLIAIYVYQINKQIISCTYYYLEKSIILGKIKTVCEFSFSHNFSWYHDSRLIFHLASAA